MTDERQQEKPSKTRKTFDVAGKVPDAERFKSFPPVIWVIELVQHLVAILILAIGRMIQLTFQREKPRGEKQHAS